MVPELLRLIPGVEVVDSGYVAPGYMCASFAAHAEGARRTSTRTRCARRRHAGAEAVVTIFHQCYREIVGLDAAGAIPVYNYIHLIARSMGLAYEDEYKAWKRAGDGAAELIGAERIAKVGVEFYERAILPELKKRPKLSSLNGDCHRLAHVQRAAAGELDHARGVHVVGRGHPP